MLTTKQIKNFKPQSKIYRKYDAFGLYLQIHPNGSKYWRMKYKFNGKEKVYSIGVYNPKDACSVSLKQARLVRDEKRILISQGIDPNVQKKILSEKVKGINTFEHIAREWHSKKISKWSEKHGIEVLHSLERDIFPYIGSDDVSKITPPKLLEVLRKIEKRGALVIVNKVRQRCNKIFNYAIAIGKATYNPATNLVDVFETHTEKNHNYLSKEQLPEYFKKLEQYQGNITTILGLKLTLLTFLRTNEIREATWDEIDFTKKQWLIPASRMKNGNEHLVPLSEQAIELLNQLKSFNGDYQFVFASYHKPRLQPISGNAMLSALYKMGYRGKATVHGFRATASTIFNELSINRDWIEKQLSHVSSNDVRNAYNHAEYLPQRIQLMQFWADYLDGIKSGIEITVPDFSV